MRGLKPLTSKTLKSPATNAGDDIDALLGQGVDKIENATIRARPAAVNGVEALARPDSDRRIFRGRRQPRLADDGRDDERRARADLVIDPADVLAENPQADQLDPAHEQDRQ